MGKSMTGLAISHIFDTWSYRCLEVQYGEGKDEKKPKISIKDIKGRKAHALSTTMSIHYIFV